MYLGSWAGRNLVIISTVPSIHLRFAQQQQPTNQQDPHLQFLGHFSIQMDPCIIFLPLIFHKNQPFM